jgi:hypothetical protein
VLVALLLTALGVVVLGCFVASFFVRRHGESDGARSGWTRTDEVFNDPSTNRIVRVWLDGKGERRYVPEGERPAI